MENPVFTTLSNNTALAMSDMEQFIPKELQMPVGVAVVVLVIALILGITKSSSSKKEVQFDSKTEVSFKSPEKSASVTKTGTPINEKTGTVMTPAGRRSARLARRKED